VYCFGDITLSWGRAKRGWTRRRRSAHEERRWQVKVASLSRARIQDAFAIGTIFIAGIGERMQDLMQVFWTFCKGCSLPSMGDSLFGFERQPSDGCGTKDSTPSERNKFHNR